MKHSFLNIILLSMLNSCISHSSSDESENDDAYFISTWVLFSFLFVFYIALIMSAYPYSRTRFPLLLFIFIIFVPPFFLFFLLYLLLAVSFYPNTPSSTPASVPAVAFTNTRSRSQIRNQV